MTLSEMDEMYVAHFGISRSDMNARFLGGFDRNIKILEVGSNVGLQLLFLQQMGFENLYGIELLPYAVELSKSRTEGINIIQGEAQDIPFKDDYFDLVFTSGLLIHIKPDSLCSVMREIWRCTKKHIWGFEYYETEMTPVEYRGNEGLLWKADYSNIYCDYLDLEVLDIELFEYKDSTNRDAMFLLEKQWRIYF